MENKPLPVPNLKAWKKKTEPGKSIRQILYGDKDLLIIKKCINKKRVEYCNKLLACKLH